MGPVVVVACLCATCLSWLFFRWRRGSGSSQFVLGILPSALLLFTVSVPVTVWSLLQAFSQIAERGVGGLRDVAPFCIGIDRALWFGGLLFLIVMGTAGMLQGWARASQDAMAPVHDAPTAGSRWLRSFVVASTLSVFPVAILGHLATAIPSQVMQAGASSRDSKMTSEGVRQASATIAQGTVLAMFVGMACSVLLALFGVANLFAAQSRAALDPLDRFSWVVLAGVGMWAAWTLVRLSTDLRAFEAALG